MAGGMSMKYAFRMLAITWLAGATLVQAQALRDPTRPPGATGVRIAPGERTVPTGGLELQSILISPERRAAIISGQVVRLGESVQGHRLVAIGEGDAVLRMGGKSRTLRLFPAVDLRQSAVATGDGRDDTGTKIEASPADGG